MKDPGDRFQSVTDLDRALAMCECAGEWSAERATQWWQQESDVERNTATDLIR
jgi:hypothetical protein